tara:strand:+ start:3630 stop:4319 length:690 start_codon:yes stop_codon:yes gene_type:complete
VKRETSNFVRFIIEELIPPIIRDSFIFTKIIKLIHRKDKLHFQLKERIYNLDKNTYKKYYEKSSNIHDETDLTQKCIIEIKKNILPAKVLDVGCGNGYLLDKITKKNLILFASDIKISDKAKKNFNKLKINFKEEDILDMNYKKKSFDTVICTHTLEHILDIKKAYDKLSEIAKKRLIIVVPKERPYNHTFNGHIHFFPYSWSFINLIKPKNKFKIFNIGRDFFYLEKK